MMRIKLKRATGYDELLAHRGHDVVIVTYGLENENVALECEECFEVIVDFDRK